MFEQYQKYFDKLLDSYQEEGYKLSKELWLLLMRHGIAHQIPAGPIRKTENQLAAMSLAWIYQDFIVTTQSRYRMEDMEYYLGEIGFEIDPVVLGYIAGKHGMEYEQHDILSDLVWDLIFKVYRPSIKKTLIENLGHEKLATMFSDSLGGGIIEYIAWESFVNEHF